MDPRDSSTGSASCIVPEKIIIILIILKEICEIKKQFLKYFLREINYILFQNFQLILTLKNS